MRLTAFDEPATTIAKKTKVNAAHVRDDRRLEKRQVKRTRLHFQQRTGEKNGRHHASDPELEAASGDR